MDLKRKIFSFDFAKNTITIEASRMAEQATVSLVGKYGGTSVLVTVVLGKEKSAGYFPLVVDYEERFYAAGKIIGSRFMRREGRPSDEAILSGRLIDRTIRPLFDKRIRRELQVVATILSIDEKMDPDFIALLTVSTALLISEIPWRGPVAGVKILRKKTGELIVNPNNDELEQDMDLNLFVAGTEKSINMIECEG